jgi:prepilin-type processing-associated H-X9-DG protein
MSVHVRLLPYMENQTLYDKIDWKSSWEADTNAFLRKTNVAGFACPSKDNNDATYYYVGNSSNTGPGEFTTHYDGVMGAKGTIPGSTASYDIDTSTMKHGDFATNGILIRDKAIGPKQITDGLSHTFLMGEVSWDMGEMEAWSGGLSPKWENSMVNRNIAYALNSYKFDPTLGQLFINDVSFGSQHAGRGAIFLLADGSVRFVAEDIALDTLKSLASRKSGEVIPGDF